MADNYKIFTYDRSKAGRWTQVDINHILFNDVKDFLIAFNYNGEIDLTVYRWSNREFMNRALVEMGHVEQFYPCQKTKNNIWSPILRTRERVRRSIDLGLE